MIHRCSLRHRPYTLAASLWPVSVVGAELEATNNIVAYVSDVSRCNRVMRRAVEIA